MRLENFLPWVLRCVMPVTGEIKRKNSMYEYLSGYEMLQGVIWSGDE